MKRIFLSLFTIIFVTMYSFSFDVSKIEEIIISKNTKDIDNYLKDNISSEEYSKIEEYIISKVREYIIKGDYEYAKSIISVLLENNFDNNEAQDIYISLQNIKAEEEKVEIEEKKVETAQAEKITFDNFLIAYDIGLLNFMIYESQFYNDYYEKIKINLKYGMSTDLAFYFIHPYFSVGLDAYFDAYFASIYPATSGTEFNYKITSNFSTPLIKVPLYVSFGFSHLIYYFNDEEVKDVLITSLPSLIIGLKLNRLFFNKYVGIDASIYYYLVSPFTSYYDAAFDTTLSLLVCFYTYKQLSFIVRTDLIAFFLIGNYKLENNIKFQVSIGMGINDRKK